MWSVSQIHQQTSLKNRCSEEFVRLEPGGTHCVSGKRNWVPSVRCSGTPGVPSHGEKWLFVLGSTQKDGLKKKSAHCLHGVKARTYVPNRLTACTIWGSPKDASSTKQWSLFVRHSSHTVANHPGCHSALNRSTWLEGQNGFHWIWDTMTKYALPLYIPWRHTHCLSIYHDVIRIASLAIQCLTSRSNLFNLGKCEE